MAKLVLKYFLHTVAWIFIYLLPGIISYKGGQSHLAFFSENIDYVHAISFLLLIGFTYLNYYYLVPRLYVSKKQGYYFSVVVICSLIVIWFPNIFRSLFHHGPGHLSESDPPPSFDSKNGGPPNNSGLPFLIGMSYTVILFIISTFLSISIRERQQRQRIEKQKLHAELAFLKAQINPHFLFNTLNSIYSLAIIKSDDTPEAIVQLSNLMRYLLNDSKSDHVLLQKELDYIQNYILLQQRRLGATVSIKYNIGSDNKSHQIVPLLLMSVIENAFKHGVNPDGDSAITITIAVDNNRLRLFVENNKVISVNSEEFGGIGLKNTKERLEHYYAGRYELTINDEATTFAVLLILELS